MSGNIVWHSHPVNSRDRAAQKSQAPLVIWFTGLSASGKSTIAGALEQILTQQGYHTYLLDGDNVRHGLCGDLGFGDADRSENIRRVGEVAKLMTDAGLITLAAFISPFEQDRKIVRDILPEGQFVEVFVDATLAVCRERDPKQLYAKADRGEIKCFTGIDSPYEAPRNPEVRIDAGRLSVAEAVNQLLAYLHASGALKAGYQPLTIAS
ncbi:MAG: adenylyl-sulfate kinase [Chromatiaceae bacterium]|nr:adenylyl-sulfate kinase [Chromatiaceae bacterium]MCP5447224.1 adenylyl-sulfate kinase [Chromatiaceae bacterium]